MKRAIIIGSGFGGLGAACLLGKNGWNVTIIEKNGQVGGRAGQFKARGFTFDSGPSWLLMIDVFERFFGLLDENIHDHLEIVRLSPSYRVFYKGTGQQVDIWSNPEKDTRTFETIEPGASSQLKNYLRKSEYIYKIVNEQFLYKNYDSLKDFLTPQLLREPKKLNVLSNIHTEAGKYFKEPRLQQIVEYPSVFLGSSPYKTPALYNLINYALFSQGVFYPKGGMYELTRALENIAIKNGTKIILNTPVEKIMTKNKKAIGVIAGGKQYGAEVVISNADMHHTEMRLLEPSERDHTEKYWQSRVLAPSALLIYLGVKQEYPSLQHHNLLFSQSWKQNFSQTFLAPGPSSCSFPADPSFYVCAPGRTDPAVTATGHENLFVLVPIAAGLNCSGKQQDKFADQILEAMETEMNLQNLRQNIVYKKLFGVRDFESRYNSFRGSALGLAHTLRQSAYLRPKNISRKVKNLYYVGASTHPGIGLPPSLISAELVYKRLKSMEL